MANTMNVKGREHAFDHSVRLLLLGDSCVGKSSLMSRYTQNTFSQTFLTTIGVDYKYQFTKVALPGEAKKRAVRLEIWDTAGQERFHSISRSYIAAAQAVVLCYDISDRKSFDHVFKWLQQILQCSRRKVPIVLVANKCDFRQSGSLSAERRRGLVSIEEGRQLAEANDLLFFETSAKLGTKVAEAFEACGSLALEQIVQSGMQEEERLVPDDGPTPSCWQKWFGRTSQPATSSAA